MSDVAGFWLVVDLTDVGEPEPEPAPVEKPRGRCRVKMRSKVIKGHTHQCCCQKHDGDHVCGTCRRWFGRKGH